MIRPSPESTSLGSSARVTRNVPTTLVSHIHRQSLGTSGVIDEHVYPVQAARQRLDRLVICDVGHNCGTADFVRQRVDPVRSTCYRDDVKPLGSKDFGGRLANPGTGTGDHRDPVLRIS